MSLETALANLRKAIHENGNGKSAAKQKFRFPADHVYLIGSDDMNALMDVCRDLYDKDARVAPKMYAILRNAHGEKL